MRRGGRVGCTICARFLFFCAGIAIASCIEYGVPIEIEYWDTGRSPLSHMVDVTNGFGLKVLAEHNFLNENNIAFSPYGLMGIMVALYEGVEGDSSYQIQRAMQLPWNRNIMRIGFRDIHRTLKTYFVPEEGFLAGLALNNENVTFNENYKKVLSFYGFELESEQTTTATPDFNNSTSTSATTADMLETKIPATVMTTLNFENASTTAKEETTTNPSVSTDDMQESTLTPSSTMTNEPSSTTETTIITSPSVTTDDMQESSTTPSSTITSTNEPSSTTETTFTLNNLLETTATTTELSAEATTASSTLSVTSTTSEPSPTTDTTTLNTDVEILTDITSITTQQTTAATSSTATEPSTITESTTTSTTESSEETTIMTTSMDTIGTTENTMTSTTTAEPTTESLSTSDTTTLTPTSENPTPSTENTMSTTENTSDNAESVSNQTLLAVNESTLETLTRRKKSLVDFIFTNPPYIEDYSLFRSYDIGPEMPITGYEFSVNGLKNIQVTYMTYDTVLEHAYLPHLEASALKLPLDSNRYYLLVVLPNRRRAGELERLLTRMARESDLSDVYAAMRPRRVRAFVPGFMVKGHVTLTTDLQKIGIREVFEPRQGDFAPMTCQVGVYVRSIEQAVSVAIRKYQPDTKITRYVSNRRRVYFSATYPFLYFVMDSSIHVALMAGKIVDPLNTRIL